MSQAETQTVIPELCVKGRKGQACQQYVGFHRARSSGCTRDLGSGFREDMWKNCRAATADAAGIILRHRAIAGASVYQYPNLFERVGTKPVRWRLY